MSIRLKSMHIPFSLSDYIAYLNVLLIYIFWTSIRTCVIAYAWIRAWTTHWWSMGRHFTATTQALKGCRYSFMKNFPIIDFIQSLCMSRTWCCTVKKQIKIRPYPGFLFFISYQRCHVLNIFYKFHKTCF